MPPSHPLQAGGPGRRSAPRPPLAPLPPAPLRIPRAASTFPLPPAVVPPSHPAEAGGPGRRLPDGTRVPLAPGGVETSPGGMSPGGTTGGMSPGEMTGGMSPGGTRGHLAPGGVETSPEGRRGEMRGGRSPGGRRGEKTGPRGLPTAHPVPAATPEIARLNAPAPLGSAELVAVMGGPRFRRKRSRGTNPVTRPH